MAPPGSTYADRQRAAGEEAQRKTTLSLRVGGLGVAVLFLSGLGAWLVTEFILAFLVTMVVGILLILWAFLLVRSSVASFKRQDRTKVL